MSVCTQARRFCFGCVSTAAPHKRNEDDSGRALSYRWGWWLVVVVVVVAVCLLLRENQETSMSNLYLDVALGLFISYISASISTVDGLVKIEEIQKYSSEVTE